MACIILAAAVFYSKTTWRRGGMALGYWDLYYYESHMNKFLENYTICTTV